MALATMAGADVLRAIVEMPARGPWTADVRLASESVPSGAVTLDFDGGLSLTGTVRRAGADDRGAVSALVVAGADGLRQAVKGHFRNGFARDVLGAILRAAGESQASDIASDVLGAQWALYSLGGACHSALDTLAAAVSRATGREVTWRVRAGGEVWLGSETWPTAELGAADAVLDVAPYIGLTLIGGEVPHLVPGVEVDGIGRVRSVRHFLEADRVRSEVAT